MTTPLGRLGLAAGVSLLVHAGLMVSLAPARPLAVDPVMQIQLERAANDASVHPARPTVKSLSSLPRKAQAASKPGLAPSTDSPPIATQGGSQSKNFAMTAATDQPSQDNGSSDVSGQATASEERLSPARFLGNASHPPYPESARARGEQGRVELKVRVGRDGQVKQVVLLDSSGSVQLDEAAKDLLRQGPFVPAKRGGKPIESCLVPICCIPG